MYDSIAYIRQQLASRGIDFSIIQFLQVPLKVGVTYYEIFAYNQLLFIELWKLQNGTQIVADNNAFELNTSLYKTESVQEFSGLVSIELQVAPSTNELIEFIQVIKT